MITPRLSNAVRRSTTRRESSAVQPDVQVVEGGGAALNTLLDEWDRLHTMHPSSGPFQSAGWLGAHRRAYGTDSAVAVARRGPAGLEAVAAFDATRRGGATVLRSAPSRVSDFNDIVLGPSERSAAGLVDALLRAPRWDVLDFRDVPPTADLWRLLPSWPVQVLRFPSAECVVMDGAALTDFTSGLPASKRRQLQQQQRGIARAGVTIEPLTGDPDAAVTTLLRLHQASWTGRGLTAEHATVRFHDLLVQAIERLGPRRQAVVMGFHQHGRTCGSALYLSGPRHVGFYLGGHHPDLRDQVNLHVLELMAGFELVSGLGLQGLNLLRGTEPYKLRFPARRERNERVLLVRPGSAAGQAFAVAVVARRRAAAAADRGRQRLAAWRSTRSST